MIFRWSQPDSSLELRNSLDRPRQVLLKMTTKGFFQAPLEISYRGSRETIKVSNNEAPLALRLDLPPNSSIPLKFHLAGPPTRIATDPRSFGFMAINPTVSDWTPAQAIAAAGR